MKCEQTNKKKNRWVLSVILVLALIINGSLLGEVHGEGYAAAIGSVNYQTLDEAFDAVTEDQTIRLLSPIQIMTDGETGIVNKPGVSFYLDLGNQIISGNQQEALLQVVAGNITLYNGQIINNQEGGLAFFVSDESTASVRFPIGYQKPDQIGGQIDIPAAYHLQFTGIANGTIRYGSIDGLQVPLAEGDLYAGENTAFSFYFVPDVGYKVSNFAINGVSKSVVTQYNISNLTQNQTINVTFKKITFTIAPKAYANNKVAKLGITLTPASATVEYGGNQTFTYTVHKGFRLIDVQVNNVSLGPVTTIELKNITTAQNVKILLEKTALFIMLDAGHYAYYNHSPVLSSYYEGNTMWTYHRYLEQSLEQYPNIIVDTTRINNTRAIGEALLPSERGAMGEGYDLVLSVHSNACSSSGPDHPVAIYTMDPKYTTVSKTLGLKLATKVAEIMKTSEAAKAYGKTQNDGRDWYGVNRGAADVGVPSIILEHSFHTNYRATVWLSQDANLRSLALAEAEVIASYYGISGGPAIVPPATPIGFSVLQREYNSLKIRWDVNQDATGYLIYRSTSPTTGFTRIAKTTNNYYVNTGLVTGKAYYYKIKAYKTAGVQTVYSGATSAKGAKPNLSAPKVSVVAGVDKATISWPAVSGAQGYRIYRAYGTTGSYVRVKTITSAETLKWTDYGQTTGKVYTYKVRAYRVVNGSIILGYVSAPDSVKIK